MVAIIALTVVTFIAAIMDYKTGEVYVFVLLLPLLTLFFVPGLHFGYGAGMFVPLYILYRKEKMGGADVLLFTQYALVFGCGGFIILFLTSYVTLFVAVVKWFMAKRMRGTSDTEMPAATSFLRQEIRIIPAVFLSLLLYLVALELYF